MKLERLTDTKEKFDELMRLLNLPENSFVKEAFWALWEDRSEVITDWNKLYTQIKR